MARIEVHPDRVVIQLSPAEITLALRNRDIVLSRAAITSAIITDDPLVWLRGIRAPGIRLTRKIAIGTWRAHGGKDFALVRPGRPAIVLDFALPDGAEVESGWVSEFDHFGRVILSTEHAVELIRALKIEGQTGVFAAAQ